MAKKHYTRTKQIANDSTSKIKANVSKHPIKTNFYSISQTILPGY
jgi:hypothetical protein